jgi:hypothetical protein
MQGTALNGQIPAAPTANTPYASLKKIDQYSVSGGVVNSLSDVAIRGGGVLVTKTNACNGNGAQTDNLFTVVGTVKLVAIWAEITQVTNGTVLSGNSLGLYDGTATLEITDSGAPLDLSGVTEVGGIVLKNGASATVALAQIRNNVGALNDTIATPVYLAKKVGVATYIQHLFTGNADTNVSMTWRAIYVPMTTDGALVAV